LLSALTVVESAELRTADVDAIAADIARQSKLAAWSAREAAA
jgi:hypothetical protein